MTLATLTISQLWGLSFMALAGGILVAGIVIDIRIAASRRHRDRHPHCGKQEAAGTAGGVAASRRRRERQAALRSGAILTGKGGGK